MMHDINYVIAAPPDVTYLVY